MSAEASRIGPRASDSLDGDEKNVLFLLIELKSEFGSVPRCRDTCFLPISRWVYNEPDAQKR